MPVMALHMISMYSSAVRTLVMKPAMCHGGVTVGQIIMVLLNVPLQFGVGYRFYRSAILGDYPFPLLVIANILYIPFISR